jgi:hypothetical protein
MRLEKKVGKPIYFKINDNRSTMLSVRWRNEAIDLSMHRFFLNAPEPILQDLAAYLKRKSKMTSLLKGFIDENYKKLDYSKKVIFRGVQTQGERYDLLQLYQSLNQEYFEGKLDLTITWFGFKMNTNRTRITLGLYDQTLKLIKIHRMMDSPQFPKEVVRFVVYHEMLHHIFRPTAVGKSGKRKIHTEEFVKREKEYPGYSEIQQWLKNYYKNHFSKVN